MLQYVSCHSDTVENEIERVCVSNHLGEESQSLERNENANCLLLCRCALSLSITIIHRRSTWHQTSVTGRGVTRTDHPPGRFPSFIPEKSICPSPMLSLLVHFLFLPLISVVPPFARAATSSSFFSTFQHSASSLFTAAICGGEQWNGMFTDL